MITISKQDDKYCICQDGRQLGTIELYENPYHIANYYVKFDMKYLNTAISAELFGRLKKIAGRPLQVMTGSDDTAMTEFLAVGGFICKRKCYEIDVCAEDYIGGNADIQLSCCSAGDPEYGQCCRMMYDYYVNTHKAINPWTADYATFCAELPDTAVYAMDDGYIVSLAFVEGSEIAYVCGTEKHNFSRFAEVLASSMLEKHERIFFESDDCDWAAMMLKSLFASRDEVSFDTYVLI